MKNTALTLIGAAALLLGSCAMETDVNRGVDPEVPVAGDALRVSVRLPESLTTQMGATRATTEAAPGEETLGTLYLLFFEPAADRDGEFVDYVEISDIDQTGKTSWDINMVGTEIDVTSPYNILAIGNVGEEGGDYLGGGFAQWVQQWIGRTEKEVMERAAAWTRANAQSPSVVPTKLLMSGRAEKPRDKFEVVVPMTRNQARFDVHSEVKDKYKVLSVEIRNAYPSASIWNGSSPDYSEATGRIPSYYKYANPSGGDIMGNLYAFENQVVAPVTNDRLTTCLIIELQEIASGTRTFYRANISPKESSQTLKGNNVYRLTINSVGAAGQNSPEEAYEYPEDNQLDYTINYWGLDGGVMVQDGGNILSIPTKTIRLGSEASTTTYQIFTFSTSSGTPPELKLVDQSYDPAAGATASLEGNTLKLVVNGIPVGSRRNGKIILGYAGLRATINVVQTDLPEDFIEVHTPQSGIPNFAPFAGIASDELRVEASGAWTAEILAEEGGFSFERPAGSGVKTILTSAELNGGNTFRVWTHTANNDPKPRAAFIVVSLDKDSENFAQVIRVAQDAAADIAIVPCKGVTFNSMGTGLAAIPDNTTSKFVVRPSETGTPPNTAFAAWTPSIEGADAAMFRIVADRTSHTTDTSNPDGNYVTVEAVGMNNSGRVYEARLVVKIDGTKTSTSIALVQLSEGIDFSPNKLPNVGKTGGETQAISVQAHPTLKWKVTAFEVVDGSPDRDLVHHDIELLGGNGAPIDMNAEYSVADDTFKVRFPKIYYPNRDIPVSVRVEIQIVGSSLTKSITVSQDALTATPFSSVAIQTGGYGNIHGGSFNTAFRRGIHALGKPSSSVSIRNNFYYQTTNGVNANYNWSTARNFRATRDALEMYTSDYDGRSEINGLNNNDSPLRTTGFHIIDNQGTSPVLNNSVRSTKIYQFLVDKGYADHINAGTDISFRGDGVSTQAMIYPQTAVPIVVQNGTDRAFLVVDPRNRIIYLGESQIFDGVNANAQKLLNNLMVYIENASIYGSHFTELLVEDADGGQKAPWDTYWGANAGVN